MLHIHFPTAELTQRLTKAQHALDQQRAPLHAQLATRLLALAHANYADKSQGGGGADGVRWKPLATSTLARRSGKGTSRGGGSRIGIVTGRQRAAAFVDVNDSSLSLGYDCPYSPYFDQERPLIPDPFPTTWLTELEPIVQHWAESLLTTSLYM